MLFEMISGRRPFPGNDRGAARDSRSSGRTRRRCRRRASWCRRRSNICSPRCSSAIAIDGRRARRTCVTQLRAIYGAPARLRFRRRRADALVVTVAAALLIVLLVGVGAVAFAVFHGGAGDNASTPPVIAVLPLSNISGDPSKDFVAAGIAESLISSLAPCRASRCCRARRSTEAAPRWTDPAR